MRPHEKALLFCVVSLLGLTSCSALFAQQKLAPEVYMINFTDKSQNTYTISKPEEFLSSRAIQHRNRQNIPIYSNDLPVSKFYKDSLHRMGFVIVNESKWLNAVSVKTTSTLQFDKLKGISFISYTVPVKKVGFTNLHQSKFVSDFSSGSINLKEYYGGAYGQIAKHHGEYLHQRGFRGQGILIAIIDAGFNNAINMTSLDSLWHENRVKLVRDMIVPGGDVFVEHQHGANVLSIMAGLEAGKLIGSAPKADYVLLRSENDGQEYPDEEFNWAVAAELADSLGVDVINTSLGYSTFDDSQLNHTYQDMDGKTTLVSKAASIAASKGMIVVVSAGNEGAKPWKYISAPADAEGVLSVGAIDVNNVIASFSSLGPTIDKRIKPDVVAVGKNTFLQQPNSLYVQGSGTSFSAPVIAGLVACLWQASPNSTSDEIIHAVKKYSSLYSSPDTMKGFGIPDFRQAMYALNPELFEFKNQLICWPNPFFESIDLQFEQIPEGKAQLMVFDVTGRKVFDKLMVVNSDVPNMVRLDDLDKLPRGLFVVKLISASKTFKTNIVKVR